MELSKNRQPIKTARIAITRTDLEHLFKIRGTRSVPMLARLSGLPYLQVYNLVHRRARSLSRRHYHMLFGTPPPSMDTLRVDGAAFRAMADLWCYLNAGVSRADLHRELVGSHAGKKPDLRMFSGAVHTVPARLEHRLREKFTEAGLDPQTLDRWLAEMASIHREKRVPYARIRPVLQFLQAQLGVHPTAVLHQVVERYESGLLKRVSPEVYRRALDLKRKTEAALASVDPRDIERLRARVAGHKAGYTPYVEVADALDFLKRIAGTSPKHYLGRGRRIYETGGARRIADWRAAMIMADCDRLIEKHPDLPIAMLPRSRQRAAIGRFRDMLVARTADLLSGRSGIDFEKQVLRPLHPRHDYTNPAHGFTRFDMASGILGMRPRAFDLMVARNCDIFRTVGSYAKRWYLSDLYLRELHENEHFVLISAKYEIMARKLGRSRGINTCTVQ